MPFMASAWRRLLDRAFGADLAPGEPVLAAWPLPYAAMAWLLQHTPPETFIGNPRVHFQHLADRMNEPRREQRRWRAWACWPWRTNWLNCEARPWRFSSGRTSSPGPAWAAAWGWVLARAPTQACPRAT